ncbi:MAG: hotdog fold thioesterase [Hyphomicrobiaceae bacterium]|nr:hotdog fold thioesterase [Hyphomicrobiaceae bacterium]
MRTSVEASEPPADPAAIMRAMSEVNPAFRNLGVEIVEAGSSASRFAMTVSERHTNTFGVCHGGLLFALADLAFGFTCNARGVKAMTAGASIDYLAPAPLGARLVADVRETAIAGRNAYYDVTVSIDGGPTVAIVRGRMRILSGPPVGDSEAG